MRAEDVVTLREAVTKAGHARSAFVEYLDDDDSQHVVTDVTGRGGVMVAVLAGGGYVALAECDPCDFRLVSPAIPSTCPGCAACPAAGTCPDRVPPADPPTPSVLEQLPGAVRIPGE
jgi:hypothetical protein